VYSNEERCYYIVELGSKSGTFLNSTRLSQVRWHVELVLHSLCRPLASCILHVVYHQTLNWSYS